MLLLAPLQHISFEISMLNNLRNYIEFLNGFERKKNKNNKPVKYNSMWG